MFEITQRQKDTFISGIVTIASTFGLDVTPAYYYGTTGHGARITLAMDVKRGKYIGHPSSIYTWDVISVIENCFTDAGIAAQAYLGAGYANSARSTAAQTSRRIPENIHIIPDDGPQNDIQGNLLVADPTGKWQVTSSSEEISIEWQDLPFGPVIIDITDIYPHQWKLPRYTLAYLIQTLERGEEPMEVVGRNNLNAVSGWKAYARWMQSFAVPLPDVQHQFITKLPGLLYDRRSNLVEYLNLLSEQLEGKEEELIVDLKQSYAATLSFLEKLVFSKPSLDSVRAAYFAEQKTQSPYKRLDTYLTHES